MVENAVEWRKQLAGQSAGNRAEPDRIATGPTIRTIFSDPIASHLHDPFQHGRHDPSEGASHDLARWHDPVVEARPEPMGIHDPTRSS